MYDKCKSSLNDLKWDDQKVKSGKNVWWMYTTKMTFLSQYFAWAAIN